MPDRYRKKPVEITAVQWTGTNAAEVREFMGSDEFVVNRRGGGPPTVRLTTVHGDTAWARVGDWIIPEAEAGRFYPCKPDVFAATYEPVRGVADDGTESVTWT